MVSAGRMVIGAPAAKSVVLVSMAAVSPEARTSKGRPADGASALRFTTMLWVKLASVSVAVELAAANCAVCPLAAMVRVWVFCAPSAQPALAAADGTDRVRVKFSSASATESLLMTTVRLPLPVPAPMLLGGLPARLAAAMVAVMAPKSLSGSVAVAARVTSAAGMKLVVRGMVTVSPSLTVEAALANCTCKSFAAMVAVWVSPVESMLHAPAPSGGPKPRVTASSGSATPSSMAVRVSSALVSPSLMVSNMPSILALAPAASPMSVGLETTIGRVKPPAGAAWESWMVTSTGAVPSVREEARSSAAKPTVLATTATSSSVMVRVWVVVPRAQPSGRVSPAVRVRVKVTSWCVAVALSSMIVTARLAVLVTEMVAGALTTAGELGSETATSSDTAAARGRLAARGML